MAIVSQLLRPHDAAARLKALVPGLALLDTPPGAAAEPSGPALEDEDEKPWLAREGYVFLRGAESPETCARLVAGIGQLLAAGLPAVAVFAFDETWRLGERVRARVSRLAGHPYLLLNDAWAWQIEPGHGRGWPPHRGWGELLDRGAPEVLNVWVALSDVSAERSCMHLVPLDEDPHYPDALTRSDAAPEKVRALPVAAGTALAWNANVLHWGGACSARAPGPRVSCSFSLARGALADRLPVASITDVSSRLDVIAQQVETYGEGQPDVSEEAREWARATNALRSRIASLSKHLPPRGTVT
jgi:hypothetical protein